MCWGGREETQGRGMWGDRGAVAAPVPNPMEAEAGSTTMSGCSMPPADRHKAIGAIKVRERGTVTRRGHVVGG